MDIHLLLRQGNPNRDSRCITVNKILLRVAAKGVDARRPPGPRERCPTAA